MTRTDSNRDNRANKPDKSIRVRRTRCLPMFANDDDGVAEGAGVAGVSGRPGRFLMQESARKQKAERL